MESSPNCCINFAPFQYPEKIVPLMDRNRRMGKLTPVYGDGGCLSC